MKRKLSIIITICMILTLLPINLSFADTKDIVYVSETIGDDGYVGTESEPFKTIGKAILEVSDGGTVHIAAGRYDENLTIAKNVTLKGDGKDTTIINGGFKARVIYIVRNNVSIEGVAIQNGKAPDGYYDINDFKKLKNHGQHGGGIYNNGNLIIRNCAINDNSSGNGWSYSYRCANGGVGGYGGGIYNKGNLTIMDSIIENNTAGNGGVGGNGGYDQHCISGRGGFGGGIYSEGPLAIITCKITNNFAGNGARGSRASGTSTGGHGGHGGHGGGIYSTGTLQVDNSIIEKNKVGNGGNGGWSGCSKGGNGAPGGSGGGILSTGTLEVARSVIENNNVGRGGKGGSGDEGIGTDSTDGRGGGIYNTNNSSNISVNYSCISENESDNLYTVAGSIDATNNWWGLNTGADLVEGNNIDTSKWIVMAVNTLDNKILLEGNTIINIDLTKNNLNELIGEDLLLTGKKVTLSSNLGDVESSCLTVKGIAQAAFAGTQSGTATISVTAGNQTITTEVTIEELGIKGEIPIGLVGRSYKAIFTGIGGVKPYKWSATNIPDGLSMNELTGEISDIPLQAGTCNFEVTLTDSNNVSVSSNYTLTIAANNDNNIYSRLSMGVIGTPYHAQLEEIDEMATYTWDISGLPEGLRIDSSGEISGTPEDTGTYDLIATAEDSNGKIDISFYTLTIAQSLSIDLENLAISEGALNPTFDKNKVTYHVGTDTNRTSAAITAKLADPSATLTIAGKSAENNKSTTVELEQGKNLIPIVVTSPDGKNQKAYVISVNGKVSNFDLERLVVSEGTLNFNKDALKYEVNVGNNIEKINITATPDDDKALVLIDGNVRTGGAIQTVDLNSGANPIEIMVVAQDASTKTYTVNVNRGIGDLNLSGISLSHGELKPDFDKSKTEYKVDVEHSVDAIIITPTAIDSEATVTVNGSSDLNQSIPLEVGDNNKITIEVTGKEGIGNKQYVVNVKRKEKLIITNNSLPIGIVGTTYSAILTAEGGTGLYTWTAEGLPTGLEINGDKITGLCGNEGNYEVDVTVRDSEGNESTKTLTLKINLGCGNGGYIIKPEDDVAYTQGFTKDGIPTMTIKEGVTGFEYFSVSITPVEGHDGKEAVAFVHIRNGKEIRIDAMKADFDVIDNAEAGFNVQPDDIIKVFIVDDLTNNPEDNPNVL